MASAGAVVAPVDPIQRVFLLRYGHGSLTIGVEAQVDLVGRLGQKPAAGGFVVNFVVSVALRVAVEDVFSHAGQGTNGV